MSLISYRGITQLLERKVIDQGEGHPMLDLVNAASLDLRLGDTILVEQNPYIASYSEGYRPEIVELGRRDPLIMAPVNIASMPNGFLLAPGQFILASTVEKFYLPDNIAAEYKLKSSMARIGLEHLNAGWCDPGWNNSVLTLELRNLTTYHHIRLRAGDKIGQVVFFNCEPVPEHGSYAVKGNYNGDSTVTAAKPVSNGSQRNG